MGREIKRVPIDFDWPLNAVWKGYRMPTELQLPTCPVCRGEFYTQEALAIANTFYPFQIGGPNADALAWHDKIGQSEVDNLLANQRLCTLKHRDPTEDNPRDWEWVTEPVSADIVNQANRRGGIFEKYHHDAINRWILIKFRCERLGIPIPMYCATCNGSGEVGTDEQKAAYDAWKREDPPIGDGWQLWETVSEGSPISPVFATKDGLREFLIKDGYSVVAVERFLASGWSPSMTVSGGIVKSSIACCDDMTVPE